MFEFLKKSSERGSNSSSGAEATGNKIDEAIAVCERVALGDFEARVLDIPERSGKRTRPLHEAQ